MATSARHGTLQTGVLELVMAHVIGVIFQRRTGQVTVQLAGACLNNLIHLLTTTQTKHAQAQMEHAMGQEIVLSAGK